MKLLITTQAVNKSDPALGFFLDWIKEFAKHCEQITVICLYKGEHDLPENVRVLSLGKENFPPCLPARHSFNEGGMGGLRRGGRFLNNFQFPISNFQSISKFKYLINFYKYTWQERKNYDSVFIHMNQIYVILGGWYWRITGKKVGLWYTHGKVSFSLRLAEKFANIIFTASKESCRLDSKKIKVVGHGINLDKFKFKERKRNDIFKIITVGRISPVKDLETIINTFEILEKRNKNVSLEIVGGVGLEKDNEYLERMKSLVEEKKLQNKIIFTGPVPAEKIPEYLYKADLFVSASRTGSLDKVVLEAMATGLPVISSNEAFRGLFGSFSALSYEEKNTEDLADKINAILKHSDNKLGRDLSEMAIKKHGLDNLIKKICDNFNGKASQ